MSLDDATRIVSRLGPCRVAIDRERWPGLARQLALLGCVVADQAPVAVIGADTIAGGIPDDVEALVVVADDRVRAMTETPLLDAGWLRHPAGLLAAEIGAWSAACLPRLTFYRRARRAEVDLLGRGADADAAIARFALAADLVRTGDAVLVGGVDAASGGAIVSSCSRARTIAVVEDGTLGDTIAAAPVRSIDAIILVASGPTAIDAALVDAAARALKADGRIMLGWQGDGGAIDALVAERFIIDRRYRQADGGTLLIASADPIAAATDAGAYHHPAFHRGEYALSVLVDFAAAYENPYLYRTMVQVGERIGDDMTLARLAECVLGEAGPASADRGAAITVLGYRVLDLGLDGSVEAVSGMIDAYLAATEGTNAPHVLRWRLSLLFLAGRLAELAGRPEDATERFRAASLADWAGFSPILATKAIAACFHEARLHLATGEQATAMACFRRGLDTALAAAAAPHEWLIGDPAAPVPFYLQEMAEVMDMGGQCAAALASAHLLDRDPGLFWRQVDVKRFGLFAWADALARDRRVG